MEEKSMATINLRDFPDDLHQAAKIKAAVDKTTLRESSSGRLRRMSKHLPRRPKKGG